MSKVIVIGAGASGIIAALKASERYEVTLIEGNVKCAKKILLTGNGKCNYWNEIINTSKYQTDDIDSLSQIIDNMNQEEVLNYLENLGIYPKIKNGYYYPYSNQSSSIRQILTSELIKKNIKIIYNFKVSNIDYKDNKFTIRSENNQTIEAEKVVLALGSKAASKTGSDGSGYTIASSLGHKVNTVTPALVPLVSNGKYLNDFQGVRCDAKVSLYIDNKLEKEEIGEIQLTNYGISGICIFNISGLASKSLKQRKNVKVQINFLPYIDTSFYSFFDERNKKIPNHTIEELLESIINYKLMFVILKKASIDKNEYWNNLSENKKQDLCNTIEKFEMEICDTKDFDKAQVCSGGVSLKEINYQNMESKIIPNLYIVGELLDVDGKCGGYNLAFAWISGYLAGKGM